MARRKCTMLNQHGSVSTWQRAEQKDQISLRTGMFRAGISVASSSASEADGIAILGIEIPVFLDFGSAQPPQTAAQA